MAAGSTENWVIGLVGLQLSLIIRLKRVLLLSCCSCWRAYHVVRLQVCQLPRMHTVKRRHQHLGQQQQGKSKARSSHYQLGVSVA